MILKTTFLLLTAWLLSVDSHRLSSSSSTIWDKSKWCGRGTRATSYDDLGTLQADVCCRAHDYCPHIILAGETKYEIKNTNSFTLLHCDCDWKFRDCLHTASKIERMESNLIGEAYFLLQKKCFVLSEPRKVCMDLWTPINKFKYPYEDDPNCLQVVDDDESRVATYEIPLQDYYVHLFCNQNPRCLSKCGR